MASRYRALAAYSALLAAGAGAWLAVELSATPAFPPAWVAALAVVACLFVFQFGLHTRIGLISMERVPQIGLLLVFSPAVAAAICATASFLWPLFNRAYSQGSTTFAALRALHNAAMTVLMLLAAGAAYTAAGGQYPLMSVGVTDLWPLAAMAIVAQLVNTGVMTLFFLFDRRDVRSVLKPAYVLSDFVFVPAGVLAALLYNAGQPSIFALFASRDAGLRAELQQHRRRRYCCRAARTDGQAVRIEPRFARRTAHRRARRAHPHGDPDAVPLRRVLLRAGRARPADPRLSRARARRRSASLRARRASTRDCSAGRSSVASRCSSRTGRARR